jgi:hypothetical protein
MRTLAALTLGFALIASGLHGQQSTMPSLSFPGLGPDADVRVDGDLRFEGGKAYALGGVSIRSAEFDLDCEDLVADTENKLMTATGDRVQIQIDNLTAVGTHLEFNTETRDMMLRRANEDSPQPFVVQTTEESTSSFWADVIRLGRDEAEQPVFNLEGSIRWRSTSNETSGEASQSGDSAMPGFGGDAELRCERLQYAVSTGVLMCREDVRVESPNMTLECDQLDYDPERAVMVAIGREVFVRRDDMEALCNRLIHDFTTGRVTLERNVADDEPPEVWQRREASLFHARADQIFLSTTENDRTAIDWSQNAVLEYLPTQTPRAAPAATTPATRRVESLDDLPAAEIDPFA